MPITVPRLPKPPDPLTDPVLQIAAPIVRMAQQRKAAPTSFRDYLGSVIEPWPYQLDMADRWDRREDTIVLKARQIGVSELATIYAAYRAERGDTVLVLSQGQQYARMFLRRCRAVLEGRNSVGAIDNADELGSVQGGRIIALPATQHAGRGYTANVVIVDEAAFHPWAAENYAAYRPTMADGGQLIVVSTANGASGWYFDMWHGAPANGLTPVFLPWSVRPGRDAAWRERERAAYEGMAAAFAAEYPDTPADAFIAHTGLVYGLDADGVAIFERGRNVREPATAWADCKYRVVGIDPGGDGDPSGLVAVGFDDRDRIATYAAQRLHGGDIVHWHEWLSRANEHGRIGLVAVGETGGTTLVASLVRMGWPAVKAVMDRSRIAGTMAGLFKSGRLTVDPSCSAPIEAEVASYYWAKSFNDTGKGQQWATETGAGHHADLLDALRYAVVTGIDRPPAVAKVIERSGFLKERSYFKEGRVNR